MGPVISLGADESLEEVYLRLENAVAEINRLREMLDAASDSTVQK